MNNRTRLPEEFKIEVVEQVAEPAHRMIEVAAARTWLFRKGGERTANCRSFALAQGFAYPSEVIQ